MILPQGRLKGLLKVDNSWIQPQQFIMVPPVPRDSGNIIADISALRKKSSWPDLVKGFQLCELTHLLYWNCCSFSSLEE